MTQKETGQLRELDKKHFWHPFTQMTGWIDPGHDPLIIESGEGAVLRDSDGREYLDGNSSIWTVIHGHNHPKINRAVSDQLARLAHCSALGFTNEPAVRLAAKLGSLFPAGALEKVFFTDDGSTAVECACKMSLQYRQLTGEPERSCFVSFDRGYHGDTAGAASLGGIPGFHDRFAGLGFEVRTVRDLDELSDFSSGEISKINAVCIEPLVQGAAGMRLWPAGMLADLRDWCDRRGVLLILDEVMTAFGRTGKMFACEHESVVPDFLCLAKGLTGGYLPLAATLSSETVFAAFLGEPGNTFFYGHSYCGNPLGCSAALANLEIFETENVLDSLPGKIEAFSDALQSEFSGRREVVEIRQIGLIAGIELDSALPELAGETTLRARSHGLLTRPIRNTLVLMPPLCSTEDQIQQMTLALAMGLT